MKALVITAALATTMLTACIPDQIAGVQILRKPKVEQVEQVDGMQPNVQAAMDWCLNFTREQLMKDPETLQKLAHKKPEEVEEMIVDYCTVEVRKALIIHEEKRLKGLL